MSLLSPVLIFALDHLKAVPKCPSIKSKHSKAVLNFIILTKVNEVCRHHYSSKNMSNF